MDEQSNETRERPKFLNNMTAVIGGTTALVVAVAGLVTATKDLWHKDSKAQAAMSDGGGSQSSSDKPSSAKASQIQSYSVEGGEGGTLTKVDDRWLWTTAAGSNYYYDELSNDGTTIVAVLKQDAPATDFYLRWPSAGGTALQSDDNRATWSSEIKLTPKKG
jgi:hypothetical protein